MLVLLFVALWFTLRGDLFYVLPCVVLLVFFSPFSIAITSLGEGRANLGAFRAFFRFAFVWFCLFPLTLGVCEGLRFVIVALPGHFSYLFYSWARPAILVADKGRGGILLFLLFHHIYSCSSVFPVPLLHLFYYLFYLFSSISGRRHKITHNGWRVVKPQHNQSLGANSLL